jgi:hypothetical protein
VGVLAIIGQFGYVEMTKFLMIKLFSLPGYLQMYMYSLFMITSSADGASRPIYGGLYTVGGYGEEYFFSTWMAV